MDKPNSRIHVCARVRPIISEDFKLGTVIRSSPEICVHLKSDGQTIKMTKDVYDVKQFRVDHTFDGVASQMDVYNTSFRKIVVDALGGFNGTGMVYGQTGSGKSHTMFGSEKEPGLVQCAINDVFQDVRSRIEKGLVANVFLSFYQLYCEQAFDLLVVGKSDCIALAVREDVIKGAFVENLQYIYVDDEESTMDVLRQGLKNRKVNSTQFNMSSSRSHAIFQMYLDFEEPEDGIANGATSKLALNGGKSYGTETDTATKKFNVRRRILTFVDLAGSERVQSHHQSKSKAQFKESVTINKSISALGNCIQALANNSAEEEKGFAESYNYQAKKNLHIPFRDCKLTRLLAEPLGGNSKTCIIVNIGPCTYNYEETKSTLKFAKRAMTVKKSVKKSDIEQLQVQDVHTEEPEEAGPSPPRPAIGVKKVASVKVSRIVVRESPEERNRRQNTDFGTDYTFDADALMGENNSSTKLDADIFNNFESVRNQLQYSANGSLPYSKEKSEKESYVVHLPAGTEFDAYGSMTVASGDSVNKEQTSVRFNLSDFLKACQAKSAAAATVTTLASTDMPGLSRNESMGADEGFAEADDAFKLSLPSESVDMEPDLTPINNTSTKSSHNLFFNADTPSGKDLSLDWVPTPATAGKPPLSPAVNRLVSKFNAGSTSTPTAVTTTTTVSKTAPDSSTPQQITLFSPQPNIDNVPSLRLEESMEEGLDSSLIEAPAPEKQFTEVVTHRTQRKFVWERGSGEVYSSTVEVTPLLNRHRGRIADVAAVAPISTNDYFKTFAAEEKPVEKTPKARATSPRTKKVTAYLRHTPSADVNVSMQSNESTPARDERKSPTPTKNVRKPSLTVVTVRDETNSMPRSFAPQPTPSPKYSSPSRGGNGVKPHSEINKEVGPYLFHKVNPTPTPRESKSEAKRRGSSKPSPRLAATIKPFGGEELPSPTAALADNEEDIPLDLLGRLNSVSQMDEDGNRPHRVLISLVHELRDELQRKEAEISSLKSFILNN